MILRVPGLLEGNEIMMTFRQVEAFRTMMACGTATQAAKIMQISQPAVSRLLSDMEHAVRLKLFARRKGRITPTAEAHMFYKEVQRVYIGLDRLHFAAENIRSFSSGTLRVASFPALGHAFIPRVLATFRQQYPGISVLLNIRSSEAVKELVTTGQFDVGFAADEISVTGVRSLEFSKFTAVCILPSDHALADRAELSPKDLAGVPFVSLASEDTARTLIDDAFEKMGVLRSYVVETQYSLTICNLVRNGVGVGLVNPMTLEGLNTEGIKVVPFKPRIVFRTLQITPPDGRLSEVTGAFLKTARQELIRNDALILQRDDIERPPPGTSAK